MTKREGVDAIIGSSQRTKGLALKIPNESFDLNCERIQEDSAGTGNDRKRKCQAIDTKLKEITKEIKSNGSGLEGLITTSNQAGDNDPNCGNISWDIESKDKSTNLLSLAKFLIKVYCFESDLKQKEIKMKDDIIANLNKDKSYGGSEELIGGIFNANHQSLKIGDTLMPHNYEELKKLIKDSEKLKKWTTTLDKFVGHKLTLRIDSNLKTSGNKKWLIVQKINLLEQEDNGDGYDD